MKTELFRSQKMHAVRRCTPGCIGGVRRGRITRRRRRSAAAAFGGGGQACRTVTSFNLFIFITINFHIIILYNDNNSELTFCKSALNVPSVESFDRLCHFSYSIQHKIPSLFITIHNSFIRKNFNLNRSIK